MAHSTRTRGRRLGALLAVLVAASGPRRVLAGDAATVFGRVLDPSAAALPDATVTARNVATGVARSVVSGPIGEYRIPALAPGTYEISAARQGFATARRTGVGLGLGAEVRIELQLEMASIVAEIIVERDSPLVATTTAGVETSINREQVAVLPVLERDYLNLLRLVPGVAEPRTSGGRITGSRDSSNTYLVDGVDNSEDILGSRRQPSNLDSMQQLQVLVNNFKAEYGRASGGVIQALTRSGTNAFHGDAFFMYRDERLTARDPLLPPATRTEPFSVRQWGGSLSGPIVRDRAHIMLSFERLQDETFAATTRPYPAPGAQVSRATTAFLQQHGVPPFPDTRAGTRVRLARPEYFDQPQLTGRVDYSVSPRHTLSLTANWVGADSSSGVGGSIFDADGSVGHNHSLYAALAHKWIVSGTKLNEFYVQLGHTSFAAQVRAPRLPTIFVDEFSPGIPYLGGTPILPQRRSDRVFQVVDNFSLYLPNWWAGSHVVKLGGDVKLFHSDSSFDLNFRGSFFFRSVDDFLAGRPRRFTASQGDSRLERPNDILALYVQDDWTLARNLTLNLGLRYDYESAPNEVLKDIVGNPYCGQLFTCGAAGPGLGRDRNNLAPRLGLTWDPWSDGRTAIHAAFGYYYDQVTLNVQGGARFTPPKVYAVQIENPAFPDPFQGATFVSLPLSITLMDDGMITPRNINSSVGVRRELRPNLALDATYVHNRGEGQVLVVNTNTIDPATGVRPVPGLVNVRQFTSGGKIRYDALLVELQKRMSSRYSFGIGYTLSKTRNNSEDIISEIQDPRRPELNYGPGDADRRHRLVANAVVRLPWSVDVGAIAELYSATPLNVIAGGFDLNRDGSPGDWPAGYSRNSVRQLSTAEANRLRGLLGRPEITAFEDNHGYWNVDLSLQKAVRLRGPVRLKLRLETFNLFNHANYAPPVTSISSALFGQILATYGGPRTLQLTGQLEF